VPPNEHSTSEGRQSTRRRGRRLPALKPDSQHPHSLRSLYRAIWPERTLYSHPAVVGADHLILHFPQHRKLALLADDPGLHHKRDLTSPSDRDGPDSNQQPFGRKSVEGSDGAGCDQELPHDRAADGERARRLTSLMRTPLLGSCDPMQSSSCKLSAAAASPGGAKATPRRSWLAPVRGAGDNTCGTHRTFEWFGSLAAAGRVYESTRVRGGLGRPSPAAGRSVNGHRFLASRGHRFSPAAAMFSPRWWPSILPASGSAPVVVEPSPSGRLAFVNRMDGRRRRHDARGRIEGAELAGGRVAVE
jgi:hypothetical protein